MKWISYVFINILDTYIQYSCCCCCCCWDVIRNVDVLHLHRSNVWCKSADHILPDQFYDPDTEFLLLKVLFKLFDVWICLLRCRHIHGGPRGFVCAYHTYTHTHALTQTRAHIQKYTHCALLNVKSPQWLKSWRIEFYSRFIILCASAFSHTAKTK